MSFTTKKKPLIKQPVIRDVDSFVDDEKYEYSRSSVKPTPTKRRVSFEDKLSDSDGENVVDNRKTEQGKGGGMTGLFRESRQDSTEDEVVLPKPKGIRGTAPPRPTTRHHTGLLSQQSSRDDADTQTWSHPSNRPTPPFRPPRQRSVSEELDDSPRTPPKPPLRNSPRQRSMESLEGSDHKSRYTTLDKKAVAVGRTSDHDVPTVKPRASPRIQSKDTDDGQYGKYYTDRSEREKRTSVQKEEYMTSSMRSNEAQVTNTLYSDDESDDEQVGKVIQLESKVKTADSLRDVNKKGKGKQREKELETNTRKPTSSRTRYLEDDSEDDNYEDTGSKNRSSKTVSFESKSGSVLKSRLLKSSLSTESDEEESAVERPTPTKRTVSKPMIPELRTQSPQEVEDELYQSRRKKKEEPGIKNIFELDNRTKNLLPYEHPTPSPRTSASKKSRAQEDLESLASPTKSKNRKAQEDIESHGNNQLQSSKKSKALESLESLASPTKSKNWKSQEDTESRRNYQLQSSKKSKTFKCLESKAKETLYSNKKSKGFVETEFGEGKSSDSKQSPLRTQIKRAGSADSLHSKISAKQNNSPRVVDQEQNHRTPYRNVLSPKRPASAKRGQIQSDYDISSTFESHFPDDEMDQDGEEYHHRGTSYGTHEDAVDGDYHTQFALHKHRDGLHSASTPKRGPMKASRGIEEMTRSPHLRETYTPQARPEKDSAYVNRLLSSKRSSSMTNLRSTSPGYLDYDSDEDGPRRNNSLDTDAIRQAVFQGWLSQKNQNLKQQLSKKALEKKRQEEKEMDELQKRKDAKKAYQYWNERKTGTLKEKQKRLKEEKKKEGEKELEMEIKKRDAKKFFDSWKAKKDEALKEQHQKKKKEIKTKQKLEEEEKDEKGKSATKLFDNWKTRKDEVLKKQLREKKKKQKEDEAAKEDKSYERTIESAEKYESWVKQKGKPRKHPSSPNLTQRAWCPNSRHTANCIPSGVSPVIQPPAPNRSRTLSGSERLKTVQMYSYR